MNETKVNLAIVVIYLVSVTAVGIWAGRRQSKTQIGYFLGDRKFTWWMIGASLFATNISTAHIVAQAGDAYRIGISAANPQLMGAFFMGVAAAIFIPLYLRTGIYTIPQFLELRFNRACKVFHGGSYVLISYMSAPVGIYVGSLAAVEMFNLSPDHVTYVAAAIGLLVGAYAINGGIASVVVTDIVQVCILIAGCVLVFVVGLHRIGDLGLFWSEMKTSHLELIVPAGQPGFPWPGVVSGLALGSLIWASTNPGTLQRTLGAKNLAHAQGGMMLAAFLKMGALFIIVGPGVIAAYLFPDVNPESAYAVMLRELMPVGLSGLVLAAMLAALMSSEDSSINSVSSIVTLDLYPLINSKASADTSLRVGKIAAASLILVGVLMAPAMAHTESIFRYMMKLGAYLSVPIGIVYLGGRFVPRINHQGALATLCIGVPLGLITIMLTTVKPMLVYAPRWMLETNFYVIGFVYGLVYFAILLLVSLLTPPPAREKLAFMTEAIAASRAENLSRPWYARLRVWFGAFTLIWVSLYLIF